MKIYIQSNKFQNIAANVAKYSFERFGHDVKIISVEENELLVKYLNKKILRNGKLSTYKNDLQSFTLLRFLAPELDENKELILVIDPDIFAIKDPIEILNYHNENSDISCTFYDNIPRSEMMLIDTKKIKWNFEKITKDIFDLKMDYSYLMKLSFDHNLKINKISKRFNSHDIIHEDTILLHTTNRITQPWKINLKVDFDRNYKKSYLIKENLKRILKKKYDQFALSNKYILHENTLVVKSIQNLFKDAYSSNSITREMIKTSLANDYISEEFCKQCMIF